MSELKSCPFCGCGAYEDEQGDEFITCDKCLATAPSKSAWNTRAADAQITQLKEQVEAANEENERVRMANLDCVDWYNQIKEENEKLRAQLAQQPASAVADSIVLLREIRNAFIFRPSCQIGMVERCGCINCVGERVDAVLTTAQAEKERG